LRKFNRYLRYEKVPIDDFTQDIPRPKIPKPLMQAFLKEETLRMFAQCEITAEKGIRDICILICAAFAGLRISEIYSLTITDVLDDGKDIDLNILDTKHDRNRVVYLWKAPAMFIRQYLLIRIGQGAKGRAPLFISYKRGGKAKGNRLTAVAIDNLIKELAEKAGVQRHTIKNHMFRAMHANDLQSVKGYTMPAIMERLGWADLQTAGQYLVRRERIHRMYNSLHEFWIDFPKIWTKGGNDAKE
jgi:integrase